MELTLDDPADALVREAAAGTADRPDLAAGYRDFMERHLDEAYRLATFVLADRSRAEDAVHDAAISAWRHWTDRRDVGRTEAWFRRIVVNACRDQIRSRQRVRTIDAGLAVDSQRARTAGHEDRIAARDAMRRLLDPLSVDDRALLSLRYGLDLTVPSIARALGLREGTVKSRLNRALGQVRSGIEATDR